MAALIVSALLLSLVTQGWTAPLEVLVDGANFTGTGFCVGDNVTFTCTLPSFAHQWRGLGLSVPITPATDVPFKRGTDDRFIFTRLGSLPNGIITSLSLIVYSGFDEATLICSDSLKMNNDTQTATATVLDTAPTINPIASADFKSFNVALSTAESSARCVIQYSLTITENGGPITTMTIIGSSGTGSVEDLNLCKNTYTFTAVAMTKNMNSSSVSVAGQVNFTAVSELSGVRVVEGVVKWTISTSLPGECYGSYSLRLSQCTIEDFAILPALNISDDDIKAIFASVPAAVSPTIMATGNIVSYERVNISVGCVKPTLRTSITPTNILGSLVLSSTSTEASTPACNISLMAESMASTSSLQTNCRFYNTTTETTVTELTSTTITTITTTGDGGGGGGNQAAVIAGVLVGIGILVLLVVIIVVVVLLCCRASKHEVKGQRLHPTPATGGPAGGEHGDGGTPRDMRYEAAQTGDMQYDTVGGQPGHGDGPGDMRYVTAGNDPGRGAGTEYDAVAHGNQPNGHPDDNLPTYQDPDTIKRQAGGDDGAIYTLVDKTDGKKKSVKKNGNAPTDEIPLYSMPDKSKKQHDPGLVYADIDVKKPAVSSRSRPPPPPQGFATEQDANGPVIYSSVQLL